MKHREQPDAYESTARPHSGLGIASFVIAIAMGMFQFFVFATAGLIEIKSPGGIDDNSTAALLLGFALIGGLLVSLLGVGLGIAGLFERRRRKVFAVLGIIAGLVVSLGVGGLLIVGMAMD